MSSTVDFYLSRAAESAQAARDTGLENVRERCLRSEAAWLAMANRLIHVEAKKKQGALDKAAQMSDEVAWPIPPIKPPKQRSDG
ncbi:MAG: hypothetical protein J7494_01755 [Sphingobium sp.]|nr:hypothetical protein [Sphingobium sp.]